MSCRVTAAVCAVTILTTFGSVSAQSTPPDPWTVVPAAPTTCYPDDGFGDRLSSARSAIQAEIEKQKKANQVARDKFDGMDMMEKAQRMQAFMMKNPQAAAKMLGGEQAAAGAANTLIPEANESARRLDAELQRQQTSFRTAVDQAVQAARAQQKQLIDAKTVAVGEAQVRMFTNPADHAQYVRLVAEENAVYEKACASYFGANGAFHKWLGSYRRDVMDKLIAGGDVGDVVSAQMTALDLPGGGYHSTVPLEQSLNYLQKMRIVYEVRRARALPGVELRK